MNLNSKKEQDVDVQKLTIVHRHDPFSVLGRHLSKNNTQQITVFLPQAESVRITDDNLFFKRIHDTDFFVCDVLQQPLQDYYLLNWTDKDGQQHQCYDPYDFAAQLSADDLHLFSAGKNSQIYKKLGAHLYTVDTINGVLFAVWAPNAKRVSVIGDFNHWDGRSHAMRNHESNGVWEIFIPELTENQLYKFEIVNRQSHQVLTKTDPYAQQFECLPNTSSIVVTDSNYDWQDQQWLDHRQNNDCLQQAISIYEVHLSSWRRDEQGKALNYRKLAKPLVDHVKELGFTHIELLPIAEYYLDKSWGYQTTGYFAPTSRHGNSDDFRYFIDYCHQYGIGVILDWSPAHFPKEAFALAQFDGSPLYELEDPRRSKHRDWATLLFNFSRNEVKNFLLSSAAFWLQEYHIDGLRVDAVASILDLEYSPEQAGTPNQKSGNKNLAAIEFLRTLNDLSQQYYPGTIIIAESSSTWPQATHSIESGGLGFSMQWNKTWVHDILSYMSLNPVSRQHHHDQLSLGLNTAFTEKFILSFSHNEVAQGQGSLLEKMPGDDWQRFANLRLLYTFIFTYPGKKSLFMGCEFAQSSAWDFDSALNWHELEYPHHHGIKTLVKDLNHLYKTLPALYQYDFEPEGFGWIDHQDAEHSVLSYMRHHHEETLIIVLNFSPIPRENYRVGVPTPGTYYVILNSDSIFYDGSNIGDSYASSDPIPHNNLQHSICLTAPPLAGLILKL